MLRKVIVHLFFLLSSLPLVAGNAIIRNTQEGIEFRNNYVSIVISENAELISCIDLKSGDDIAIHNHNKIARLVTTDGKTIVASRAKFLGNILQLTIGDKIIYVEVTAFNHYFTAEVKNESLPNVKSLTFLDLRFLYDFSKPNVFLAAGVAMSLQTDQYYYPSGEAKAVFGSCFSQTGIKGAKLAIIACGRDKLRYVMQEVYNSLPKGTLPISSSGGPFALDNELVKMDCLSTKEANPETLQSYIDVFSKIGVKQFDFLLGGDTFIQGQFTFPKFGTAAEFKRQISDPLMQSGIVPTMHSFSFYIDYDAKEILSDPYWQQQLEFQSSFKLLKTLSAEDAELVYLDNREELIDLCNDAERKRFCSPYMLIENEIVKFSLENDRHIIIQRGQCGTKAVNHKRGSKVRVIGGYYSCIAPQPDSELFYEIARRTAKAYNEAGFRGIYFDAFDGLQYHLEHIGLGEYLWYYGASFINEFVKHCKVSPMVEYSWLYPSIWSARGRGGAWDIPYRGYKEFVRRHSLSNQQLLDRMYVSTLGWFNMYPNQDREPWDYSTKYVFEDDIDYIGTLSVAYNQTMVYNHIKVSDLDRLPAMRRNIERYAQYSELRNESYFSESVLDVIKKGESEYRLERIGSKWGFREAKYCRIKLNDISLNQLNGINPFKKQMPFIRLENLYSSVCNTTIPLISFDESKDFVGQDSLRTMPTTIDLSGYLGLKVSLKGNGEKSSDAICIRLLSTNNGGVADFVIRTNFDGWRTIVLPSLDNGDNPDLSFEGMDTNIHRIHRFDVDYSKISAIQIYRSGKCQGIKIKEIGAVPLIQNLIENPTIRIGDTTITFLDTIKSGEYVEYNAGDKKATVFDHIGNSRYVAVVKKGRFKVPNGNFSATVTGETGVVGAPAEVVLTFGLYGGFIHN